MKYLQLVEESGWLSRARGNVLKLKKRLVKWEKGNGDLCVMCGGAVETLDHVVLDCGGYEKERDFIGVIKGGRRVGFLG